MSHLITIHIVNDLPLHNMNRDELGQPKSQMDGGVQRARLSPQSLKRAARLAHGNDTIRTRYAAETAKEAARTYARSRGIDLTDKQAKDVDKKLDTQISALVKKSTSSGDSDTGEDDESKNPMFFAHAEIDAMAAEAAEQAVKGESFDIASALDAQSPALPVAAFGRMFAVKKEFSTVAAVAVSQATTTHQMNLVTDYFSVVEESEQAHSGAGHLGVSFATSGVYYRTITIDADQLQRSWKGYDNPNAREQFDRFVKAMIRALPSGRLNNSNAHTDPAAVLIESQRARTVYGFETPVRPDTDGGYLLPTLRELAAQREIALEFDPQNVQDAIVWTGKGRDIDFRAERVNGLQALVDHVTAKTFDREPQ